MFIPLITSLIINFLPSNSTHKKSNFSQFLDLFLISVFCCFNQTFCPSSSSSRFTTAAWCLDFTIFRGQSSALFIASASSLSPQVECLCSICRTPRASRASETQSGPAPRSAPAWPPLPSSGTPWPSASSRHAPAAGSTAAWWGKKKKVSRRVIAPVCLCQRSEVRNRGGGKRQT